MTLQQIDDPSFRSDQTASWPLMRQEAYHGLAGQIIGAIAPQSEADPVALLLQFLTAFGNVAGPYPHVSVEADQHPARFYSCLVGETGKGRKGTSLGYVRRIFSEVEPTWARNRIKQGLSSGEGVIWEVRDGTEAEGNKGADPGAEDKRLLIMEPEFAMVLRQVERNGNTLSAVIRQAWDGEPLSILTKNNPVKARDTHVSLISHITSDELARLMTGTEKANGFANRFLWAMVRRSKCLPEGGKYPMTALAPLIDRLKGIVEWARMQREVQKDAESARLWMKVYPNLTEGRGGLLGAITNRGDAITLRLSLAYALLDRSNIIRADHLRAALAVWEYCRDSANYIFGNSVGDPVADRILETVREKRDVGGASRTEFYQLFGRHISAHRLEGALRMIQKLGLIRREPESTEGRDVERWFPCDLP